jgi:hypothetical protein
LSLHRSATKSFGEFVESHGFRAVHWPDEFDDLDFQCSDAVADLDTRLVFNRLARVIEDHDAFSDLPFSFLSDVLLDHYPDALFLIVLRSVQPWIRSVRDHIGDREFCTFEKLQYWKYSNVKENFISKYDDSQLEDIYVRHVVSTVNSMQRAQTSFRLFKLDESSLDQSKLAVDIANYIGFKEETAFPTLNVSPRGGSTGNRAE